MKKLMASLLVFTAIVFMPQLAFAGSFTLSDGLFSAFAYGVPFAQSSNYSAQTARALNKGYFGGYGYTPAGSSNYYMNNNYRSPYNSYYSNSLVPMPFQPYGAYGTNPYTNNYNNYYTPNYYANPYQSQQMTNSSYMSMRLLVPLNTSTNNTYNTYRSTAPNLQAGSTLFGPLVPSNNYSNPVTSYQYRSTPSDTSVFETPIQQQLPKASDTSVSEIFPSFGGTDSTVIDQ